MRLAKLFSCLILLVSFSTKGQSTCDSIYTEAEELPKYGNVEDDIVKYGNKVLTPIVAHCVARDSILITKLYYKLIINSEGKVIEAHILKPEMTSWCRRELESELMKMEGWSPARHKGKAVCCEVKQLIGCILWK